MPSLHDFRSNFRFGRVGDGLRVRQDGKAYGASLRDARNVMVLSDGTVRRRWGTVRQASLPGETRIEGWSYGGSDTLLAISNNQVAYYQNGALLGTQQMPFNATTMWTCDMERLSNRVIFTDELFKPQFLVQESAGVFDRQAFAFGKSDDETRLLAPFRTFNRELGARLSVFTSAGSLTSFGVHMNAVLLAEGITGDNDLAAGTGEITFDQDFLTADHVGLRLRLLDGELEVTEVNDARRGQVKVWRDIARKLDPNPFWFRQGSTRVEVAYFDHGLVVGAKVFFAGLSRATSDKARDRLTGAPVFEGNPVGAAHAYVVERVVDKDHFEVVAEVAHDADELLGGSDVYCFKLGTITNVEEPAFSEVRGWPQACALHQGRLWLACSRSLPDAAWASAPADYTNFDPGDGSPADAITLYGIGDGSRIVRMLSQIDLLMFSETGEYYVPGVPDEPTSQENVRVVNARTSVGAAYCSPRVFDGSALYVDAAGTAIREFVPVGQNGLDYDASPITVPISDWVSQPRDSAVFQGSAESPTPYCLFVNGDGALLALHSSKSDDSYGWCRWDIEGAQIVSVAALRDELSAVVLRGGAYLLVKFDTNFAYPRMDLMEVDQDAAAVSVSEDGSQVVVDGVFAGRFDAGAASFSGQTAHAGLPMPFEAAVSPPLAGTGQGPKAGKMQRIVSAEIHWRDTETGTIHGRPVLNASDQPAFAASTPVDGWRRYVVGIRGREPVLSVSGDEPGEWGMRALTMNVHF